MLEGGGKEETRWQKDKLKLKDERTSKITSLKLIEKDKQI